MVTHTQCTFQMQSKAQAPNHLLYSALTLQATIPLVPHQLEVRYQTSRDIPTPQMANLKPADSFTNKALPHGLPLLLPPDLCGPV